jgi:hypothetical protein
MTVALVLAANRPINALTLILIKQIPPARQGVTFRWLTVSSWQVSKRQDLTPFLCQLSSVREYRAAWALSVSRSKSGRPVFRHSV